MPLTKEQIQALLAKPTRQGNRSSIDYSDRSYQNWFKLAHKMLEGDTGELAECSNPNCSDPRRAAGKKSIMVVEINGQNCCRHCFLEGYLLTDADQLTLPAA